MGMRILFGILCTLILVTGCAGKAAKDPSARVQPGKPVVTPDFRASGKIVIVNPQTRYVIVNFPITNIPKVGSYLSVYRGGLKVGELKVTGPVRDGNAVADLKTGEAQVKDEAREE